MKTVPILSEKLECLGIYCHPHALCTHYAAVEGSTGDEKRIGTCMTRDGAYPMFVEEPLQQASLASAKGGV